MTAPRNGSSYHQAGVDIAAGDHAVELMRGAIAKLPDGPIKADAPKRIVMHFVHNASKSQMVDAFNDSFKDNSPDAVKTMKADIDRLLDALEPVKPGDEMVFTYVPGTGTTFAINGAEKLTITGPAFGPVLFSVWLGPKPPNADLKKGMLGQ